MKSNEVLRHQCTRKDVKGLNQRMKGRTVFCSITSDKPIYHYRSDARCLGRYTFDSVCGVASSETSVGS
jgi:hypothetical protein